MNTDLSGIAHEVSVPCFLTYVAPPARIRARSGSICKHSSSSTIPLRFLQVVNITLDNIYELACEAAGTYVDSMLMLDGQQLTVSKFIDAFKNMDHPQHDPRSAS